MKKNYSVEHRDNIRSISNIIGTLSSEWLNALVLFSYSMIAQLAGSLRVASVILIGSGFLST